MAEAAGEGLEAEGTGKEKNASGTGAEQVMRTIEDANFGQAFVKCAEFRNTFFRANCKGSLDRLIDDCCDARPSRNADVPYLYSVKVALESVSALSVCR